MEAVSGISEGVGIEEIIIGGEKVEGVGDFIITVEIITVETIKIKREIKNKTITVG